MKLFRVRCGQDREDAVLMLHGATGLIDDVPAFNVVWRHAGVTDYVLQTGSVDPHIDAYFNWPGFFILVASLTSLLGFGAASAVAGWAPLAFNLQAYGQRD